MLRLLSISNFVIVDRMELEFSPGFTVLAGETGAGKSIMIDALSLTLGERGDSSQIRQGCERAEVSALFDIEALPELRDWLDQHDLQGDPDSCILRRVLDASGRSRALINGHAVTLQQLRAAGEYLIAIHSQHAHQALLQKTAQRDLLDAFAGSSELAHAVKAAFQNWRNLQQERVDCEQQLSASHSDLHPPRSMPGLQGWSASRASSLPHEHPANRLRPGKRQAIQWPSMPLRSSREMLVRLQTARLARWPDVRRVDSHSAAFGKDLR